MPDPPSVDLFTRYVYENPWPLGFVSLAVSVAIAWLALRDGRTKNLWIAAALLAFGGITVLTGHLVTTSAEHGKHIVRSFVAAVVDEDLVGSAALLTDDIRLSVGSLENPARDAQFVADALSRLARSFEINDNTITTLQGFTESSTRAEVHLGCRTDVEQDFGYTLSRWILRVEQVDDQWKITRLCCVSINGQKPTIRLW